MSTMTIHPQLARTAPVRSARPGELRLTRRGRVVVVLLGLALAGLVAVIGASMAAGTDSAVQTHDIVVGTGDTLWGISGEIAEETGSDLRSTMTLISELNDLDGGMLVAGQTLEVPVG
ncbi:LysM peptidoglycan-binding domain-containing protein [Nocardioides bruguierae]|uniref:LysM peptidoglycan-binding domain-containing protein n=1 Tax=Nocardioides bruguierae TaxID=2945102 RepID=A0A9X2D6N7_9ACTN|nr:LysM peptidoglycan-binding domain-containing protein [Nocardioides bruguierae]MCL8025031.1 LysM peptidoglycan-binding domain-containing protein [Nocardioides bruguierae]MCM0620161.1 LysM peptidoglycan-binding domain-containing protein [Nocardioides bruguierae]